MLTPVVGEHYIAKVSNDLTVLRFDGMEESRYTRDRFLCTNLKSGRQIGIKSKQKFRRHVPSHLVSSMLDIYSKH